ncbi:MAG: S8 family serine peptidase [Phycisphaerales bacterium]
MKTSQVPRPVSRALPCAAAGLAAVVTLGLAASTASAQRSGAVGAGPVGPGAAGVDGRAPAGPNAADQPLVESIPGEFIIAIETDDVPVDPAALIGLDAAALQPGGAASTKVLLQWNRRGGPRTTTVMIVRGVRGDALPDAVVNAPDVIWTQPHRQMIGDPRELTPNDPDFNNQYHHPLMQNDEAWDITLGHPSIIIGVTDDGVETSHPDLAPNIWSNPGEVAGNGFDDDGNGFVDDVEGWDFLNDNADPSPDSSGNDHGTHVAGIAAARTDNGVGVSGTAGGSTIMPLQFYTAGQSWTAENISEAFRYGADNGARIMNMSYNLNAWVGDKLVEAAFDYIYDAGVLHFNSAGNGNQLNPPRQIFHQTFLVASTDSGDQRASSSNHGTGVDVAAPGSGVFSTITNGGYGFKSGTSMAAPNACGVAALVWSANPTWTRDQVAAQVLGTTDNIDAQNPAYVGLLGTGRVNSFRALTETPAPPSILSVEGVPESEQFSGVVGEVRILFSGVFDPATVNGPDGFRLVEAGPDGAFGTADDVPQPITVTEYLIAANEIKLNVDPPVSGTGSYRFIADGSVLADPFGTTVGIDTTFEFQICPTVVLWADDETGTGWSVQNVAVDDGAWESAPEIPVGGGDRGDPANDFDGSGLCWLTDNVDGNSDIDGGPTRLLSPTIDLSAANDPVVRYARWFDGSSAEFRTEISNNGGGSWVLIDEVNGDGGWESISFAVADFVTPTDSVRLRFSASDNPNDTIAEAGLDGLEIVEVNCDTSASPDINGDGVVNVSDLLAVLAGWGPCPAGPCVADVDGDGQVGVGDLLSVLAAWS